MTPAFKHGFVDEMQKIAAAVAALIPPVLQGLKTAFSSPTARKIAVDAGTNMFGSFMSRSRKPPQGTGMNPPVGGVQ
jgi:hypothetical protein